MQQGGHYLGDVQLPTIKAQFEYSKEMVDEFTKAQKSILHFAENYFYITTLDEGKRKIKLYKSQKRILKSLKDNRFVILLASRQCGKSTMMTIYALWTVCFQKDKSVMIIANKEQTAREIYSRVRTAYELLPNWLKPGVKEYGKEHMRLANDSKIDISTTTSTAARGQTSNILIIDEMAFIQDTFMDEFWGSVIPIVSSSKKSKIFAVSTPNGTGNKFYQTYTEAERGENGWSSQRIDWWEVPGRDEKWKIDTSNSLGSQESFDQEFGNVFIELGTSPVDAELLEHFRAISRDPEMVMEDGHYKIWLPPEEDHIYTIGVDVSEGVGAAASVAQVFDITDLSNIKQCAQYHNSLIDPYHFGSKLLMIGNQWGRPPMLIERNNCGGQVIDALDKQHGYENIVNYAPKNMKHQKGYTRLGVYSHTNPKYKGVVNMRYWTNSLKSVSLYDIATVHELETFVQYPNGTWKKKVGDRVYDDRVMSMIWALFILDEDLVYNYFNVLGYDLQGKPIKLESTQRTDPEYFKINPLYRYDSETPIPAFVGGDNVYGDGGMDELTRQGWKPADQNIY